MYGDEVLKNVGHQQMQDRLYDVGKISRDHLETSLRHSRCATLIFVRVGGYIAIFLFGNVIDR